MVDKSRKRRKPSEPRKGRKSPSTALLQRHSVNIIPTTAAEYEILKDQKISPIFSGLQSPEPNNRALHLLQATNLLQDEPCRKILLKEGIVSIVLEHCLEDASEEVVSQGFGLLQKLVKAEGYDIAVHLYRKGILEHVERAAKNTETMIDAWIANPDVISRLQQSLLWGWVYSILSLATGLCESAQDVLEAVTSQTFLTEFAIRMLDPKTNAPITVRTAAAVFFDRLTDENEAAYKRLWQDTAFINHLLRFDLSDPSGQMLQSAATCSTLHNLICSANSNDDDFEHTYNISDAKLTPTLTTIVQSILSRPTLSQEDDQALFLSLETLADMASCSVDTFSNSVPQQLNGTVNGHISDDDMIDEDVIDDDASDVDNASEASSDLPSDLEDDLEMVTGDDGTVARASSKTPTISSLVLSYLTTATIPIVLPIATASPSVPKSSGTPQIRLQSIALLSSIANAINKIQSSKKFKSSLSADLLTMFTLANQTIWQQVISPILLSNNADILLAEKVTTLSLAVATYANGDVDVSKGQHRSFIALFNAATDVKLRVECIKVISRLAQTQGRIEVNKELGTFLISTVAGLPDSFSGITDSSASKDEKKVDGTPEAEVVIEALNGVYDVYADGDYDYDEEVFVKFGFLKYLRNFVGRVRVMVKQIDKRKHFELREKGDEAVLNLNAFIKYKTSEHP